jgi:hypothetical protein
MLVTRITDHVSAALGRLLQQFKDLAPQYLLPLNSDNSVLPTSMLGALIAVAANEIQNLENALYPLNEGRMYFNGVSFPAVGAQLDGIGALVGIARNGLSDAEYLVFITATIAENFSQTTIPDIINVASLLFQETTFLAFELYPAEFDLEIPNTTPLDPALFGVTATILHNTLGAGIGLGFIATYSPTNAFRFSSVGGPTIGGGFGTYTNPALGGEFAGLIFSSTGA